MPCNERATENNAGVGGRPGRQSVLQPARASPESSECFTTKTRRKPLSGKDQVSGGKVRGTISCESGTEVRSRSSLVFSVPLCLRGEPCAFLRAGDRFPMWLRVRPTCDPAIHQSESAFLRPPFAPGAPGRFGASPFGSHFSSSALRDANSGFPARFLYSSGSASSS